MIALLLLACAGVRPAPAATEALPDCRWWSYGRPWYDCADLFRCYDGDRTWVQTRPRSRTTPAARFPSSGCAPSDIECVSGAEFRAVTYACGGTP